MLALAVMTDRTLWAAMKKIGRLTAAVTTRKK
jgi:hypothetical protein